MTVTLGVVLRTLLALLALLIVTRILGRRTLSELTFYDFVIGLVLGNIGAAVITEDLSVPHGAFALAAATLWVLAINMLTLSYLPARKLIESEPLVVMRKGKILEDNLRKRFYNVNDLLEMLRIQGIFDPQQVEAALIEADGRLSVLKKPAYQTPAKSDFHMTAQAPAARLVGKEIIIDGAVIGENLTPIGMTPEQLETRLHDLGIAAAQDVTLAMITPDGNLYVDRKSDATDTAQSS